MKRIARFIFYIAFAFFLCTIILKVGGSSWSHFFESIGLNTNSISLPTIPQINLPIDFNPPTTTATNPVDTSSVNTPEQIQELVNSIRVSSENQSNKYNRDIWEKPAKRYNLNGKSLSRVKYATYISSWLISEEPFEYLCPYTGKTITDITTLDYEHLIALNYIHKYGDITWDENKKNEFAYDLNIGVPVLNSANRSKSDKGPSEWLPNYRNEDFCYSWLWIAKNYDIALRQVDIDVCIREIEKGLSNGETLELLMQYK